MIERELAHREVLATVLASVGIPREDVPAIEPQPAARHAVALGQPNHTRCLQVVAHRSHPVVVLSWLPALIVSAELGPELRELTPALERIGRILACLSMHDLGKLPKEKPDARRTLTTCTATNERLSTSTLRLNAEGVGEKFGVGPSVMALTDISRP